jgi:hypothetical protein
MVEEIFLHVVCGNLIFPLAVNNDMHIIRHGFSKRSYENRHTGGKRFNYMYNYHRL